MTGDEKEAPMVRYLLGLATEEERTQIEERYFSEGEYFDQLLALEDSLIDDFVTGRMPAEQRSAFKESFEPRKGDVRFSHVLIQAITKKKLNVASTTAPEHKPQIAARESVRLPSSFRRFSIAASIAAVILLATSVTLFLRSQALRLQLSDARAEAAALKEQNEAAQQQLDHERSLSQSSARELENERNKRIEAESHMPGVERPDPAGSLLDFIRIRLGTAFMLRGSGTARQIPVPENIHWLRFEIPVRPYGQYESYRISIKPVGQRVTLEKVSIRARGAIPIVVATIAADELRPGDYILTLYGEKPAEQPVELEAYSFRIES